MSRVLMIHLGILRCNTLWRGQARPLLRLSKKTAGEASMKKSLLLIVVLMCILLGCDRQTNPENVPPGQTPTPETSVPVSSIESLSPVPPQESLDPSPTTDLGFSLSQTPSPSISVESPQTPVVVPDGPIGLTPEELSTMVEDDNYWYYHKEGGTFRQSKTDHSNTFFCEYNILRVSSGWTYYIENMEYTSGLKLWRMDVDGGNQSIVFDSMQQNLGESFEIRSFCMKDDYLALNIYSDDTTIYGLYCYNLVTKDLTRIVEFCENYNLGEDNVYYVRDFTLYVTNLKTKVARVLVKGGWNRDKTKGKNLITNFVIATDEVYYFQREPYGVYRYANGERKLIMQVDPSEMYVDLTLHGEKLYFRISPGGIYLPDGDVNKKTVLMCYDPVSEQLTKFLTVDNCSYSRIVCGVFVYWDSEGNQFSVAMES